MIAKYSELVKADLLDRITYIWNEMFGAVFLAIILFIFVNMWTTIFAGNPTFSGFTLAQMIWYLAVAEIIAGVAGGQAIEKIGEDVRTGTLATSLLKPINYVGAQLALQLGLFYYKTVTLGLLVFPVAYLLVGPIPFSVQAGLGALMTATFGIVLNFTLVTTLGLLAFWYEDTSAFYWVYQKSTFILGGMLVPLDIYPTWLYNIIQYLPFSLMVYGPAKLFIHYDSAHAATLLLHQLAWVIAGSIILFAVYNLGIRRVNIHGG